MKSAVEELEELLAQEFAKFSAIEGPAGSAVVNLVREIDVVYLYLRSSGQFSPEYTNFFETVHQYGWPLLLSVWYAKIDQSETQVVFPSDETITRWADATIHATGKLARCRQVLSHCKIGLSRLSMPVERQFVFSVDSPLANVEAFDLVDFQLIQREVLTKKVSQWRKADGINTATILKRVTATVPRPIAFNLPYRPTDRVIDYFRRQGAYHVFCEHLNDDFGPTDLFGSIPYADYVRMVEYLAGLSLMHIRYCEAAQLKFSGVELRNILTVLTTPSAVVADLAHHLGRPQKEAAQMLACITLTEANYEQYLGIASAAPPPFIQLSLHQLLRSAAGCLNNPFQFLNHELYRVYKSDYDQVVNNREDRFRQMIFSFFPDERFVCIPNEVKISAAGGATDIDAIVFDKQTGTLGLFQLKWQSPFGQSMQKRRSVASNLRRNALSWLEKVLAWLDNTDTKTQLNALQITRYFPTVTAINDVRCFIIGRHSIHFTDLDQDERAAWGSWPQLVAGELRGGSFLSTPNPISRMYDQLLFDSPKLRIEREGRPLPPEYDLQLQNFSLKYRHTSV